MRRLLTVASSRVGLIALAALLAFAVTVVLLGSRSATTDACVDAVGELPGGRFPVPESEAVDRAERECLDTQEGRR